MNYDQTAERLHGLLEACASDLAPLDDEDGSLEEMSNPVLTEWVLIANVVDLGSDEVRMGIVSAPNMLRSHVVGLLAIAREATCP